MIDLCYFQAPDFPSIPSNATFDQYTQQLRTHIEKIRLDLTPDNHDLIINANAPFELRPEKPNGHGVLLIHGLLEASFCLRDIGIFLQKQGFLVRALLLPGHGTVPGALRHATLETWKTTVRENVNRFKNEVNSIYLAGMSTGGALAVEYALSHPCAGLLLFSPAFKIKSKLARFSHWYKKFPHLFNHTEWFLKTNEIDYAKYQSIPFNAIHQVYRLTEEIKNLNKIKKIECPVLMAASADDETVETNISLEYFKNDYSAHEKSRFILYAHTPPYKINNRVILRPAAYPESGIDDISHVAIPHSPNNPHYGKHSDFLPPRQRQERLGVPHFSDLLSQKIKAQLGQPFQTCRRLTFNPDFDFLCQAIQDLFR